MRFVENWGLPMVVARCNQGYMDSRLSLGLDSFGVGMNPALRQVPDQSISDTCAAPIPHWLQPRWSFRRPDQQRALVLSDHPDHPCGQQRCGGGGDQPCTKDRAQM